MDRRNITIREDQSEWLDTADVNLSRLVQDILDEQMGPTDDELADAYVRNEQRNKQVTEEWDGTSREASQYLGDAPAVEGNGKRWNPEHGLTETDE